MNSLKHLISLYKIHRRNWQTLKQKEAHYASSKMEFPVHLQHQLEDEYDSMVEHKNKLVDYKSSLQEEQARKGINTPPEVLMDIEDIDKILKEHYRGV